MRILAILAILSAIGGIINHLVDRIHATPTHEETAMERVLRTNTIRCGYYVYPPVTYRDPNTGVLSGFSVDMMNAIAAKAGMKVEWAEEFSFGNWTASLDAKRFDVACTPQWPNIAVGRVALLGKPFLYSSIHAIGRAGDNRFKTLADLDKPEVKISVHEGNDVYALAQEALPHATLVTLAPNAEPMQPILDVLAGKADIMISDDNAVAQWNATNSKKIAVTAGGAVIKLQAFTLAVKAGENDLNNFLNNAVDDMTATGATTRLLDKWMPYKGVFSVPVTPAALH